MQSKDGQRGIVIGPILFLIAIIGVLAAAIAAGTGGFSGSSSTSGAKVLASAILDYANTVKIGVDRVMANGCSDTEISFENPIVSAYTNPNAPSDKPCHVFDVNGGGITYKKPPSAALEDTYLSNSYNSYNFGNWLFAGLACIRNLGNCVAPSYTGDLKMILTNLRPEVCREINQRLGRPVPANDAAYTPGGCPGGIGRFSGSYTPGGVIDGNSAKGSLTGCFKTHPVCSGNSPQGYNFYQVLIVR